MRILYHHRTLGDGAEGIHIREMINAFRARDHEVAVAALVGDGTQAVEPGKRTRWTSVADLLPRFAYELAEYGYNFSMRHRIVAMGRDRPVDFVYDRYNTFNYAAQWAARTLGVPHILEVNAPVAYERIHYESRRLVFSRWALRCEERIFRRADHCIVVSTPLRDHLLELGVSPARITVMANGADPQKFDPSLGGREIRRRYGLEDATVIGFVGILRPWHGIDLLLRAVAGLERQPHVLFVGDGPIEDEMKTLARQLGLEQRAVFAGRVAHDDVARHVAAMDVAVSPRATHYASPMKLLEYMAMGVAVVAPDMPNIRDIVEPETDGLLFAPEDADSLRATLQRLCDEPNLRRQLASVARRKIEQERNWDLNAVRTVELVERLKTAAA